MPRLKVVLALGSVAHHAVLNALKIKLSSCRFAHNAVHRLNYWGNLPLMLVDSYHTSRYNVNTGKLNADMFDAVMDTLKRTVSE